MTTPVPDAETQPPQPLSRTMIELPAATAEDAAVKEIMERGNIPLLIGETILAEVANQELTEGLEATSSLDNAELANISSSLAGSISEALNTEHEACDMAEVAADAAALFVLCLRRSNLLDVDNIPACHVSVSESDNEAQLIVAG